MSKTPKFLAEGSYGCVHRPSLRCNKTIKINYKNKISKIMSAKNAKKELKEYVLIDRADPTAKYYLGKPETCKFEKSDLNDGAVKMCKIGKKVLSSKNEYNLIIMPDGGDNLEEFAQKMNKLSKTTANKETMRRFWKEAGRLFRGIQVFIKFGIVHHDLKPQNIVYNVKDNRCNFIDFGIMEKIQKSRNMAIRGIYGYNFYHWNFTPDSVFFDQNEFEDFIGYNAKKRTDLFLNITNEYSDQLGVFYNYTVKTSESEKIDHLAEWNKFLLTDINSYTFSQYITKAFDTFDLYGIGLSLMYVLHLTKHLITEKMYMKLNELLENIITPNLSKRLTIEEAIEQYENIVSETNVSKSKMGVDPNQIEKTIKTIAKKIDPSVSKSEILADLDPKPIKIRVNKSQILKSCPEGKILNPKTNRCNKVKTQKVSKKCPPGKILNPKTNRCNKTKSRTMKKCPPGKILNPKTNRCNKTKSRTMKKCPPGKILNPKTNRCNKTKQNKIRNMS
jgi:serine/threonine protein kinase